MPNRVFEEESLLLSSPVRSMTAIFVKWYLLAMMEEKELLYSELLVHALSSACKTLCWLKVMGFVRWAPCVRCGYLCTLAFLLLVWSQDLSDQNSLNHLWTTGSLGVRSGNISGGKWARKFYGSVGQYSFYFLPLGSHVSCCWQGNSYSARKLRKAYVDGRKTEPYGSQYTDCQWHQRSCSTSQSLFPLGKKTSAFLANLGGCWSLCGQVRGSGLMAGVLMKWWLWCPLIWQLDWWAASV